MSLSREIPEKRESAWIAYKNDDLGVPFRVIDCQHGALALTVLWFGHQ